MKFIKSKKSKAATALTLLSVAFAVFSFMPTKVTAHETSSVITYSPILQVPQLPASALQEADELAAAAAREGAKNLLLQLATGVVASLLANALSSTTSFESFAYPVDVLDR